MRLRLTRNGIEAGKLAEELLSHDENYGMSGGDFPGGDPNQMRLRFTQISTVGLKIAAG